MKKLLYGIALMAFMSTFVACEKTEEKMIIDNNKSFDIVHKNIVEDFAIALTKVLSENKECRDLIKNEALKMIDDDYDVLYMLIKDNILSSGKTLENYILNYLSNEQLSNLLHQMPTLTIFVPKLPDESFSATNWNTDSEKPSVAYVDDNNIVNYIDTLAIKKTLAYNEIPLFPIVVLKKSERIILKSEGLRSTYQSSSTVMKADNGLEFVFSNEIFDNIQPKSNTKTRLKTDTSIPSNMYKMFEAKRISSANNVWQRDYIYYDISTLTGKGAFRQNYGEHLYSFQLLGDAFDAYNRIVDQDGDPHYNSIAGGARNPIPLWTDGEFEFWLNVKLGSQTAVADGIRVMFKVKPEKLFELDLYYPPRGTGTVIVKGIRRTIKYILPTPLYLFSWNFEKFSDMVKITIEEQDDPETITNTEKNTSTFATNFEFNLSIGEKQKVGAKYGATMSESKEVVYTIVTTKNSDPLGDIYIDFGDDVIISDQLVDNNLNNQSVRSETRRTPTYYPNYQPSFNPKYTSGNSYKIEVATLQIY